MVLYGNKILIMLLLKTGKSTLMMVVELTETYEKILIYDKAYVTSVYLFVCLFVCLLAT